MSKFIQVQETAKKEAIHQEQVYETIKYRRAKDLQRLARESDIAIDRRRNRNQRTYTGKAPILKRAKTLPPKGYLTINAAAEFVGIGRSTLINYLNTGRVSGQKFNSPETGMLCWYVSKLICKQLKARRKKGLPMVPTDLSGARKGY